MSNFKGKPNISLVRGPIVFRDGAVNNEATPSIAFAYISAYLQKKGYEACIIDAIGEGLNRIWPLKKYPRFNCQGLNFDKIIARIPKNSEVIGFSGMFSGEWPVLKDLITQVREHFSKALFVAGGEHITALTEYSLRECPSLDVCVRGEGEHTFYELLESYSKTGKCENVNGISYLDEDGCYHQNGTPNRIQNIDEIPWPNWPDGYLEMYWAAGKSYGIATERDMPFMISRGCPYRCTFCSSPQMWGNRYILRNVNDVIDEIKHYIEQYNISSVQLYDLTAIIKKSWIVEFCQRLINDDIKLDWSLPSGTRSEVLDAEVLNLLKKTGCKYLVYAPESGSTRTLKNVKKHIKLNRITESIMEAKRQGLTIRINLIIGFPGETWGDVFKTLLYGLKMSSRGVDEVPIFVFSPYPGTEIFEGELCSGKITLNDEYFLSLTSLNSAYLSTDIVSCNTSIGSRKLGMIRVIFILANYVISYLLHPHFIIRTARNLFSDSNAATVFEHRLKDLLKRKEG